MKKIDIFGDDQWYDEEFPSGHQDKELIKIIQENIKSIISEHLYTTNINNIKINIENYLSDIDSINQYKIYITGIYSFDIYIEFKENDIIFNCQIKNRLS